jgi:ribonuclease J
VHLSFYDFAEMIDMRPAPGSEFIHSMSEPFTDEDLGYEVMRNWIDHFKLRFHQLHASGHASRDALSAMIGAVKPRNVIPIHTEHPELFERISRGIPIKPPHVSSPMKIGR